MMSLLRARTFAPLLLVTVSVLALPGCGGGGGGGDGGGSSGGGQTTGGGLTFTPDKSSISFNFVQGQSPAPQTITVTATGQYTGALYIAATVSGPGLASTIPTTITGTTGTAQVSAASGLAAGNYSGQLNLMVCSDAACAHQLGNSPIVITYSVTVTAPPPPPLTFTPDKTSISWVYNQNQSPSPQIITITQTGPYTGNVIISVMVAGPGLASTTPVVVSGTTSTVQVSPASGLAPGTYAGQLTLLICSDVACLHQLGNSPLVVTYSIDVMVPPPPTVGGTVSGLNDGQSVTLLNNGGDAISVVSNGAFVFATPLAASGGAYAVTVQSHTAGITCAIDNGSGTAGTSDVTNVAVSCATGTETTLYAFGTYLDGSNPRAGLIMDSAGNFYGTTSSAGALGHGTVFKMTPAGTETTLYSFAGGTADGGTPYSGVIMDSAGNLYGSTLFGGANDDGTVFKLTPTGTETVLHSFSGGTTDGWSPYGGVVMDGAGNLYGTTRYGGSPGPGTVYKITPAGTESLLYSFDAVNGANPGAGLIIDNAGNLYGTTVNNGGNGYGSGAVFKVTPAGAITDLYSFMGTNPGVTNYGTNPWAELIMDSAGNLYGTTYGGGTYNFGTVFKVSPTGQETVLYSFAGGTTDGAHPEAGLLMDSAGNLFGTTYDAGASNVGIVFMISASGKETVLHHFAGDKTDGGNPLGTLVMGSDGNLYGTTYTYGPNGVGTVFVIN
jgi:uncharacterized repeat protein (TIGR03803 family)